MADTATVKLGERISIRGVDHICIAEHGDALLFLQIDESGDACQYVVAHGVYTHENELCWLNGDYFMMPLNASSATALKKAVEVML